MGQGIEGELIGGVVIDADPEVFGEVRRADRLNVTGERRTSNRCAREARGRVVSC